LTKRVCSLFPGILAPWSRSLIEIAPFGSRSPQSGLEPAVLPGTGYRQLLPATDTVPEPPTTPLAPRSGGPGNTQMVNALPGVSPDAVNLQEKDPLLG